MRNIGDKIFTVLFLVALFMVLHMKFIRIQRTRARDASATPEARNTRDLDDSNSSTVPPSEHEDDIEMTSTSGGVNMV
jgi:hypothetical protein